jgi:type II secretory pathway predicted ATPase ExeA
MYKDFYQFHAEPFSTHPDPGIIFVSNTHKEAWYYLLFSIDSQEPYLLLTGEYGMGKTLLCLRLIQVLSKKGKPTVEYIATPNEGYDGILRRIASGLGISEFPEDISILQSMIYDCFRNQTENARYYLIIDDAQELDHSTLIRLKQLSTFNHNGYFPLSIIFAAHPSFLEALKAPALISLNQRIKRRYHLSRFSYDDTKNYIHFRLQKSGAAGIPAFTEESLQKIFAFSGGVPRLINNICDTCLLVGASKELTTIPLHVVEHSAALVEGSLTETGSEIYTFAGTSEEPGEFVIIAEPVQEDRDTEGISSLITPAGIEAGQSETNHDKAPGIGNRLRRIVVMTAAVLLLMSAGAVISQLLVKEGQFSGFFPKDGSPEKNQMVPRISVPVEVVSQTPQVPGNDPVLSECPNREASALQHEADSKTPVESLSPAGRTDALPADPAVTSSKDVSVTEGQIPLKTELPLPENTDLNLLYPYSLKSSSYQQPNRALQELAELRLMGLMPYLVKVDLGDMGIWWRVFIGFYATDEEAKKVKSTYKLSHVTIQKTDFACQVGEYTAETELEAMFDRLKQSDFFPYVIQKGKNRFQLYVGAYERKAEAELDHRNLLKKGFKNQIVKR